MPDAEDKCVDVPEDKDSFQDADGCPDFDNDGDAVADSVDHCSDTPAGVPVDEQGCPRTMKLDQSRVLRGVSFKKGSAESAAHVVHHPRLRRGGDARLSEGRDLEVHTTVAPSGQKARDDTLSQQRADAVVAWLVQRGVVEAS